MNNSSVATTISPYPFGRALKSQPILAYRDGTPMRSPKAGYTAIPRSSYGLDSPLRKRLSLPRMRHVRLPLQGLIQNSSMS
jgi:hypothetical protein